MTKSNHTADRRLLLRVPLLCICCVAWRGRRSMAAGNQIGVCTLMVGSRSPSVFVAWPREKSERGGRRRWVGGEWGWRVGLVRERERERQAGRQAEDKD